MIRWNSDDFWSTLRRINNEDGEEALCLTNEIYTNDDDIIMKEDESEENCFATRATGSASALLSLDVTPISIFSSDPKNGSLCRVRVIYSNGTVTLTLTWTAVPECLSEDLLGGRGHENKR
nr:CNT_HP1_G0007130.mRNA.1.CDS.1 [Saccharomyces cerevisiae]